MSIVLDTARARPGHRIYRSTPIADARRCGSVNELKNSECTISSIDYLAFEPIGFVLDASRARVGGTLGTMDLNAGRYIDNEIRPDL